jgi:ABC-type glycerol-3-phosphate transport system substrate-binding protein
MRMRKALAAVLAAAVMIGQGCTKGPSPEAQRLSEKVVLKVWAVIDDQDVYEPIIRSFQQSFPQTTIEYNRFRLEEYEDALLNALSEDRGPDVFMIHNTWPVKYLPKILPQPSGVKVAQRVVTGTVRKEVTIQVVDVPTLSPRKMREEFADQVAKDAIRAIDEAVPPEKNKFVDRVVGIPMSVDTIALYYNKDLLNAAGIATPPESWDQFQNQVRSLVRQDALGNIIQAGAGFGTGRNVERASDILSLLMMQNGTEMANENGFPTFDRIPAALRDTRDVAPALQALQFYTDFANPGKDVYTWNAAMPNSLESFISGSSAFFLGYSYHLPTIRARAPKLNLGLTEVPQIADNPEVNFANYWMWTVSKKTKTPDLAWLFVNTITSPDNATLYLDRAKRPAARRGLLGAQVEDEDIGVFASQVLTAKSWYKGADPRAAEEAMTQLIETVVSGSDTAARALRTARDKVDQTIRLRIP